VTQELNTAQGLLHPSSLAVPRGFPLSARHETDETWVHLRLCMICGHVGCCDSSKNRHATKHFRSSHHPIMRSLEPGETWGWCYVDQVELAFT